MNFSYPSEAWVNDCSELLKVFHEINPDDDILRNDDIINYFKNIFLNKFPQYNEKIMHVFSRKCVYIRIRKINEINESKKRKSETAPNSARGLRKRGEYELS